MPKNADSSAYYYEPGLKHSSTEKAGRTRLPELDKIGASLDFAGTESYNVVRTNLNFSLYEKAEGSAKIVGMTSAAPQEGKSLTTINLAYSFAKNDAKVLLISADLRKPSVEYKLGIDRGKGLSNILCGESSFDGDAAPKQVLHPNLSVLTAGDVPPNPSELLGSVRMKQFLEEISSRYDIIFLDLPPVNAVIDAVSVSPYLDGMVVVVMNESSQKRNVRRAMNQLEMAHVRLLGFVYNGLSIETSYYRKNYGYKYNYQYGKENNNSGK